MTIEVTLDIRLPQRSDCMHASRVADRLGGELIVWTRAINGTPARATFKFETEAQCDLFLTLAHDIPGLSLVTSQ